MSKLNVCVLFGGISPEHAVSLRSAESVLNNMDAEKYQIFPVGITRQGQWILFGSDNYGLLPGGAWEDCPDNCPAMISPVRGDGLLIFDEGGMRRQQIDVVFLPVNGVGNNMNMVDAKRFCEMTGARRAVPMHCGLFDSIDMNEFAFEPKAVPAIYEEIVL